MASIKSRNTGPELALWAICEAFGREFVKNDSRLPGTPDAAFWDCKLAVFVHGCFWHGCPRHYRVPKSNVSFWKDKVDKNMSRDARVCSDLEGMGWTYVVVWECELSVSNKFARRIEGSLRMEVN